jgi:hypothetical protein
MGEYAIRISDRERIKIGTCEEMMYLRYEDRDRVRPESGSVNVIQYATELRFRLPFPEEDHLKPGEYHCDRHVELAEEFKGVISGEPNGSNHGVDGQNHRGDRPCTAEKPRYKLTSIGPRDPGNGVPEVRPMVQCMSCGRVWNHDWEHVFPHIPDEGLQSRLRKYFDIELDRKIVETRKAIEAEQAKCGGLIQ